MVAAVVAIAAERSQIDAADERDLAVDDHELLVVAVHRALVRVELAAYAGSAEELLAHGADIGATWREGRKRRPSPQQHANLDSLGQLCQQVT